MDANDKKDDQKPEVYKIVTLRQGTLNRREFVKSVVAATGAAAVAMSVGESEAQAKNRAGPAVNMLLLDDTVDPCSTGCQCHMVCASQSVGTCECNIVRSTCKPVLTGQKENAQVYDQSKEFSYTVCTCDRVAVCSCNTVCTCNTVNVCPCDSHNACPCQSHCPRHGGGTYYISYWYPN